MNAPISALSLLFNLNCEIPNVLFVNASDLSYKRINVLKHGKNKIKIKYLLISSKTKRTLT